MTSDGLTHIAKIVANAIDAPVAVETGEGTFLVAPDGTVLERLATSCPDCDGEGVVDHPHLGGFTSSIVAESPPDPVMVECETCGGSGLAGDDA